MTNDDIRKAQPGQILRDPNVSGLHLKVSNSGQKSFFLYYRTKAGIERRPKLGTLESLPLQEARKRAKAILAKVALGEDPKGDWDQAKAELTVSELFERCHQEHWSQERYIKSGWAREVERIYKRSIEKLFGRLKLSEVTTLQVRQWHQAEANKPYTINRALNVLSKLFTFAEEQELRPQNTNPAALVKAHSEKKRKRFATREEIGKIVPILERESRHSPAAVAFLYLLMYSGSRPRAIERATWEQLKMLEINGEMYGVLSFEGKTSADSGDEEKVILPPQAMLAIARLPKIPGETITGIKMPRRLWTRIRKEVGCEDLWARDWRRTFATLGLGGGLKADAIGELLNHKSAQTTKIYAKLMEDEQVEAVKMIAEKLDQIVLSAVKKEPV